MVTYIFTPWRYHAELLRVRRQFFPEHARRVPGGRPQNGPSNGSTQDKVQDQHHAVARVTMWMQRGNCPHLVESTALLMAAILSDDEQMVESEDLFSAQARALARSSAASSSSYAVRAAYSAAFSRFVTGLLDGHQDKQRKMSMYAVAKSVGLPATFVELRHQATHEQLPSLTRLRVTARKALDWIWDYYWRHLPDENESWGDGAAVDRACRDLITRYLEEADELRRTNLLRELKKRDEGEVLKALDTVGDSVTDSKNLRGIVALTREILGNETKSDLSAQPQDTKEATLGKTVELLKTEVQRSREELDNLDRMSSQLPDKEENQDDPSWTRVENWVPKPIGVV